MIKKNCVYCDKEITTPSREHVIQNALGGLYESTDICCGDCNNFINREIDKPFTTIFNPILGGIGNMAKTNNKDSAPMYTGTVLYNGKSYSANIKNGKVSSCAELSRELRCDASKLKLEIVSYDFNLQNTAFHNGMAKIAFNYALASGVDFNLIKPGVNITKSGDKVKHVTFDYPMVPFYPLNPVDDFLELRTPFELYHNMILFSQSHQLWCYIDLFNTFQYYVLLSDNMPADTNVYNSYAQTLEKMDRIVPDIKIYGPKDALIYAQQYGVEPCMDVQEMTRRIKNAIAIKSQKQPMTDIIGKKLRNLSMHSIAMTMQDPTIAMPMWQATSLYLDANERLNTETFRALTIAPGENCILSYPEAIAATIRTDDAPLKMYTAAKFERLNRFLCERKR